MLPGKLDLSHDDLPPGRPTFFTLLVLVVVPSGGRQQLVHGHQAVAIVVREGVVAFARQQDTQMEVIARALFVAIAGVLATDFFGSREYARELWLLLGLAPALLAIARSRETQATG